MPRLVSCRRCGKPGRKSLCGACHGATYGSAEYQSNARLIRYSARCAIGHGMPVVCVICGHRITGARDVTVEHIRSVSHGGSNAMSNLGPAHAKCNYAKRSSY